MQTLMQDVRFAIRQFRRVPLVSAFIVATLAIGIGATTSMFSVIDTMLLRPVFHDDQQLVRLNSAFVNRGNEWSVSLPNAVDWARYSHSFSSVAWYQPTSMTLTGSGQPERIQVTAASPSLFDVVQVKPIVGRAFTDENAQPDGQRVIVLGYGLWQSHFAGDPSVVGRALEVNGRPATVIGVMPRGFAYPSGDISAYMALRATPSSWSRSSGGLSVLARMRDGITVQATQRDLDAVSRMLADEFPNDNRELSAFVRPFRQALVGDDLTKALYLLGGAVALVLIIACVNVAGLLLARASERERELAVRAALGAGRKRVVRQLLTEGILLAAFGGALGIAVAMGVVRALPAMIPASAGVPTDFVLDTRVLAFTFLLTVATGIAFSVMPALRATATDLNSLMGIRAARNSRAHERRRSALVVFEVALAVILLVATGLSLRGLGSLLHTNPGFSAEHLITGRVPLDPRSRDTTAARLFYERLVGEVRALPGTQSASLVDYSPMSGTDNFNDIAIEGRQSDKPVNVGTIMVGPDYMKTMGIPIVAGRDLSSSDVRSGPGAVVVNRALAEKLFPGENAVGKRVLFNWESGKDPYWRTIVGVYGNVLHAGLDTDKQPQRMELAVPILQLAWTVNDVEIVARTRTDPRAIVPDLRRAVSAASPTSPLYDVKTMTRLIDETSEVFLGRVLAGLLAVFGTIAVLLAALGLYGVISHSVTQRTFEIGVRTALGADRATVLRMILGQGGRLAAVGVGFGLVGAYVAARLLRSLLHGISPTDAVTLIGTCALLAAIAALATLVPALRASRIEPSVALREG